MNNCQRCGDPLREGARFCIGCAAPVMGAAQPPPAAVGHLSRPPAPPPGNRAMIAVALGALVVTLALTATLVIAHRDTIVSGTAGAAPEGYTALSAPALRPATSTATATRSAAPTSTTTTTTTATGDPSVRSYLDAEVAADRAGVEGLVGYWVPQVSAKQPGMVVHGISFGYEEVWQDFQDTRGRYPGALMLRSGDFPVYQLSGFWVTVVPQLFDTGDSANAWCDAAGFAAEDCYAKRLTHSGSSQDNTRFRQ